MRRNCHERPKQPKESDMLNQVSHAPSTLLIQDWDALFHAVGARLRSSAESGGKNTGQMPARDWLRTEVLECVAALTQLQAQVAQERDNQARMAQDLVRAEAALACAHHQLATTRAGERLALHQARHDGLTRLPNRDGFQQRLTDELAQRAPAAAAAKPTPMLAVLYLDLDSLKPINDQHGHHAGDQLLRIVAARLARAVRREDMVCRMGGDEFACLLTKALTRDQLSHLACKLFDTVSAPLKIGALELTVRPSIGIALCPGDGVTADRLLRNADSAMYRAKRQQLGYAFFDVAHDSPQALTQAAAQVVRPPSA
jgi:diguanylate cyclase (GGDEF)-like protein